MNRNNQQEFRQENPGSGLAAGFDGHVRVGQGRTEVDLQIHRQGRDWLLQITGGQAHIGAVAVAWQGDQRLTVIDPHKEGPLAEKCARRWADLTGMVCVAAAGIHQDEATFDEIKAIVDHVDQGLDILVSRWQEAEHERES